MDPLRVIAKKGSNSGLIDQSRSQFNFLALRELFARMDVQKKQYILDLGPARAANIEFFSNYSSRIYVEDLYRTHLFPRIEKGVAAEDVEPRQILEALQAYPKDTRFDFILFWDLFDYLEPSEITAAIKHLGKFCHPQTLLFFVTSSLDKIPHTPAAFRILDSQHLSYENDAPASRPGRHYTQSVYRKLLPGFRLYRGFRMSTGIEENLFVWEGS